MDQRAPLGRILAGWIAILLCSLLLYDALLYSSLRTATREGTQASASVAATALKSRMAIGIRFGKKLETYHNIDRLLASVVTYFVLSFAGQVLMIVTAGLTFRHLTKIVDSVEISVQQNPLPTMAAAWGGALLILAAIGAILWAVTQYFIGKKLNLG